MPTHGAAFRRDEGNFNLFDVSSDPARFLLQLPATVLSYFSCLSKLLFISDHGHRNAYLDLRYRNCQPYFLHKDPSDSCCTPPVDNAHPWMTPPPVDVLHG